jgi:hypothetical protein
MYGYLTQVPTIANNSLGSGARSLGELSFHLQSPWTVCAELISHFSTPPWSRLASHRQPAP